MPSPIPNAQAAQHIHARSLWRIMDQAPVQDMATAPTNRVVHDNSECKETAHPIAAPMATRTTITGRFIVRNTGGGGPGQQADLCPTDHPVRARTPKGMVFRKTGPPASQSSVFFP